MGLYLETNIGKQWHKYEVYSYEYKKPMKFILFADCKNELRIKLAIANLTIGKCLNRPFDNIRRWAKYSVHKIDEMGII